MTICLGTDPTALRVSYSVIQLWSHRLESPIGDLIAEFELSVLILATIFILPDVSLGHSCHELLIIGTSHILAVVRWPATLTLHV